MRGIGGHSLTLLFQNRSSPLLPFGASYPHLLEGTKAPEDRTTQPSGEPTIHAMDGTTPSASTTGTKVTTMDNLDPSAGNQGGELEKKALGEAWEGGGGTSDDQIGQERATNIRITGFKGGGDHLRNGFRRGGKGLWGEGGIEEDFGDTKTFRPCGDIVAIGELKGFTSANGNGFLIPGDLIDLAYAFLILFNDALGLSS